MSDLTPEQRVIRRALALMQNKGYGWSKAVAVAADLSNGGHMFKAGDLVTWHCRTQGIAGPVGAEVVKVNTKTVRIGFYGDTLSTWYERNVRPDELEMRDGPPMPSIPRGIVADLLSVAEMVASWPHQDGEKLYVDMARRALREAEAITTTTKH